jgi:hypothetical protein
LAARPLLLLLLSRLPAWRRAVGVSAAGGVVLLLLLLLMEMVVALLHAAAREARH